MTSEDDTDTPETRAFKDAVLSVCKEHGMSFGIAVNGQMGVWMGADAYRLEAIRWAKDLTTTEAISAFARECGLSLNRTT